MYICSDRFLALKTLSGLLDILMISYKIQMTSKERLCSISFESKWGNDEQLDASRLSRQSLPLPALSLGGLPIISMQWLLT